MTVLKKSIPIALMDHYQQTAVTVCQLLRIRTKTGQVYGFTDLDIDVRYDPSIVDPGGTGDNWGMVNHAALNGGFSLARLDAAADLSVDNSEVSILPGDASVTVEQLMAGFLDSADVRIYRVNYMDLSMGHECVAVGNLGDTRVTNGFGTLEYRSLTDQLKEPMADLWSKTCPHVFGGPECPKGFTWAAGTVTAVDDDEPARIFGSGVSASTDQYKFGIVQWLTGKNAGKEMEVDQNTGGTFALSLELSYRIELGDTFRVREDCSKVYDDSAHGCIHHWGESDRNLYFGGFPDIPTADGGASMVPGARMRNAS